MNPALRSARLLLRPLAEPDRALYAALYGDAEVMRHIGPALTPAAADAAFDRLLAHPASQQLWVIDDGAPCGLIGLSALAPASAELGFMLLAGKRRRGYAAEAIRCLSAHALQTLRLQRLLARHTAANPAVAGLMQKLGYRRCGADPQHASDCAWELLRAADGTVAAIA